MKTLCVFAILLTNLSVVSARNPLQVDFRYAPDWHTTSICLPDDTFKTLVGPEGQLLYDFGGGKFFRYQGGQGFKTVFHILPDEGIKFEIQKLYSPKVPIIETYARLNGLEIKQETFAYSSEGLQGYGSLDGWNHRKTAAREDIILTHITNNSEALLSINPMVVVNSEFPVMLTGQVVSVKETGKLYLNHPVLRARQNLGPEKTLVELRAIAIEPGNTVTLSAIYDNGMASNLTQKLVTDPQETTEQLKRIKRQVIEYWESKSPIPFNHISIPDKGIQDLIDASLRNIWQAREVFDGKFSFQVGPTCYRGLWIVDGAFLLETATIFDRGSEARDGIEYMLSFQQLNGKFGKLDPKYWKENGIVLWTCVRHAMLTQDKDWLRSIWSKLTKTIGFIKEMRQMTLENDIPQDDGLIPPGMIDGGLRGADDMPEYTNVYWNLIGLKAMVQAAEWLDEMKDAEEWSKEYEDFYASFHKAAHRDLMVDDYGNNYLPIPMDPKHHSLPQRAQWAFCHGVYPGQLFLKDDPIARGTLDMLHTTLQEGMVMGTGWITDGIWNYFAGFYGHACLWMGEGDRAAESLYAFANHASPMLAWREEQNPRDLQRHFVGDMPHNWASAEFIRLAVHLIAIDRGNELHLFEGLPLEWVQPRMEITLRQIATPFGKLTMSLTANEFGTYAILTIDKLTDPSCEKIVIHRSGWTKAKPLKVIKLDPSKSHAVEIRMQQQGYLDP